MNLRRMVSYAGCFVLVFATAALAFDGIVPRAKERGATAISAPGWGVEVGRANEGDIAELLADQNVLRLALSRVRSINAKDLGKERFRQLLGIESEILSLEELMKRSEKWWKDEIEGPMERIAGNPAASCAESQAMFSLLLGNERQKQLLGFATSAGGDVLSGKIAALVKQRCREEKLDECNATGRFKQIIQWALGEERQAQLLSGSGTSEDSWMTDALTECANYELHYVSTTKLDYEWKLDSVIDGRVPIRFKPNEGGLYAQLSDIKIEGETESDVNPFLQSIKCAGEGVTLTCGPGSSSLKTAFSAIVDMEIKSREDYLDENGLSKSRVVGDNKLKIKFSPSMLSTAMVVRAKDIPPMTLPNLEVGATGFMIAHKKSRTEPMIVTFDETERGVYPILFEFTRTGGDTEEDITAFDTTKFELIHKPNKKPFPTKAPTPPRRVIRGKP